MLLSEFAKNVAELVKDANKKGIDPEVRMLPVPSSEHRQPEFNDALSVASINLAKEVSEEEAAEGENDPEMLDEDGNAVELPTVIIHTW